MIRIRTLKYLLEGCATITKIVIFRIIYKYYKYFSNVMNLIEYAVRILIATCTYKLISWVLMSSEKNNSLLISDTYVYSWSLQHFTSDNDLDWIRRGLVGSVSAY